MKEKINQTAGRLKQTVRAVGVGIATLTASFFMSAPAYAAGVQDSQIVKGTEKLVGDVTTWLMVLAPVVAGLLTLLVNTEQAQLLAHLEESNSLHLAFVYRGTRENAEKFLAAQDQFFVEPEEDTAAQDGEQGEVSDDNNVADNTGDNAAGNEPAEEQEVENTVWRESMENCWTRTERSRSTTARITNTFWTLPSRFRQDVVTT